MDDQTASWSCSVGTHVGSGRHCGICIPVIAATPCRGGKGCDPDIGACPTRERSCGRGCGAVRSVLPYAIIGTVARLYGHPIKTSSE